MFSIILLVLTCVILIRALFQYCWIYFACWCYKKFTTGQWQASGFGPLKLTGSLRLFPFANLAVEKSDCTILNMTDRRLLQSRNYRRKSWLTAEPSQKMIGQVNVLNFVSGRPLFHMTPVIWSTKLQSISLSIDLLKICDINQKM